MKKKPGLPSRSGTAGFSLVEVVVALGVVAFAMVPLLGMLPVGLSNNLNASAQTAAANLVTAIAADVRTPTSTGVSTRFSIGTATPQSQTLYFDDAGTLLSSPSGGAGYRASVQTVAVSSTQNLVRITVTWPGQAAAANAAGLLDTVVSVGQN